MALEGPIQSKIITLLKRKGYWPIKIVLCNYSGFPDIIVLGHKEVFFIEAKATGKVARPLQEYIHEKLRKRGFDVIVPDSKEDVVEYLKNKNG